MSDTDSGFLSDLGALMTSDATLCATQHAGSFECATCGETIRYSMSAAQGRRDHREVCCKAPTFVVVGFAMLDDVTPPVRYIAATCSTRQEAEGRAVLFMASEHQYPTSYRIEVR